MAGQPWSKLGEVGPTSAETGTVVQRVGLIAQMSEDRQLHEGEMPNEHSRRRQVRLDSLAARRRTRDPDQLLELAEAGGVIEMMLHGILNATLGRIIGRRRGLRLRRRVRRSACCSP